MIKELVYLGIPYTGTKDEMNFRASVADIVARDLSYKGVMVYSPISSWHHIAIEYNMPTEYTFWKDMCESFLSRCDKLIVIRLPGWETSVGLQGEIEFARENGIEIEYFDPWDLFLKAHLVQVCASFEGEL